MNPEELLKEHPGLTLDDIVDINKLDCDLNYVFWIDDIHRTQIDKQIIIKAIDSVASRRHPAQPYPNWATQLKEELKLEDD